MYQTQKKLITIFINILVFVLFVVVSLMLLPNNVFNAIPFSFLITIPLFVFIIVLLVGKSLRKIIDKYMYHNIFEKKETKYIIKFINKLRYCYSYDDLYKCISDILENEADCSVLLLDSEKNYVLYNSPNYITSSEDVHEKLSENFPVTWNDGVYFIDDNLGIVSSKKKARAFFFASNKQHFFIFCRYAKLFDSISFTQFFEEFKRFQSRSDTISSLVEISDLTKEWKQLAETQQYFLPQKMPKIQNLKIAAYYKPLVNVSGDYYSVHAIDKNKTLLLLGDVSGKGLAAALLMGLVVNTLKIIDDKENLVSILIEIDKSIKKMKLQDKYTVLFLGIIDTEKMIIKYINASMSDPLVLSRSPNGYRIKPLTSNAGLIGILDLDDIKVAERKLYHGDTILMSSDGLSEAINDNGVQLGDTEIFTKTLQLAAEKSPAQFIDDVVKLLEDYVGEKKMHDDITMMVAKVV